MVSSAGFLALMVLGLQTAQVELPGTSSVSVFFQDPGVCRGCHGGFDEDATAYETWIGSPMAHAARNPLYLSALLEAEKDVPGVGDFCLRCHAPAAWMEGRCVPTDGSGLFDTDGGVTCSACHRMQPSTWQRNGQYLVADDIYMRGPLMDPMAPHRAEFSEWFEQSELCGSCHDLRNPLVERVDLDGTPMGMPFPEQVTYTEWATSAFATESISCQDCHMPQGEGRVAMDGPVRPDRSSHALAGGNAFLLGAVAFLRPDLGLATELVRGQSRIDAMLRSAVDFAVEDPPTTAGRGEAVALTFRVTNLSGHKLPTGYPEGRRVWLEVAAPDVGLVRGAFDTATGEPVDPVVTYEAIQGQYGIGPGHRLALNDAIFFDNRIPPRGLVVTATTAPVGVTYPEVSPGVLAHWDDVTVTATVPCDFVGDAIEVDARLWYQSVTKRYVDTLVAENGGDPRGGTLQVAFEEADPGPAQMATLSLSIAIDPASTCDPVDAGTPDSGVGRDGGAAIRDGGLRDAGAAIIDEEGGCGCSAPGRGAPSSLLGVGLLGLLTWRRRRR